MYSTYIQIHMCKYAYIHIYIYVWRVICLHEPRILIACPPVLDCPSLAPSCLHPWPFFRKTLFAACETQTPTQSLCYVLVDSLYLSIGLHIYLSVYLFFYPSIYLSIYLRAVLLGSLSLCLCLSLSLSLALSLSLSR